MHSETSHSKEGDSLLLERLKQGKEEAWKEVFDRYHTSLYYLALDLLNDGPEAKDAVQEVLVSMWARHEKLNIKGPLRCYLESAIKFHCFDKIETLKTYHKHLEGFGYLQNNTFAPLQFDNSREIQFQQLATAIQQVSHDSGFKSFRLMSLERKSYLQAADELGISPGLVRKQVSTIYGKIRKILNLKK